MAPAQGWHANSWSVPNFFLIWRGLARTQVPATRNCTVELLAFGVIAGVSPSGVQCKSLALEEAPWWSGLLPRQVSMKFGESTHMAVRVAYSLHVVWTLSSLFREDPNAILGILGQTKCIISSNPSASVFPLSTLWYDSAVLLAGIRFFAFRYVLGVLLAATHFSAFWIWPFRVGIASRPFGTGLVY